VNWRSPVNDCCWLSTTPPPPTPTHHDIRKGAIFYASYRDSSQSTFPMKGERDARDDDGVSVHALAFFFTVVGSLRGWTKKKKYG